MQKILKHQSFIVFLFFSFLCLSCTQALEKEIESLSSRINALETAQKALEKNLFITTVTQTDSGYIIKFSDGTESIINNGKVEKEGETLIKSIVIESNCVVFYLTDGSSFSIPLYVALSLEFERTSDIIVVPNSVLEIPFSWVSALSPVKIETLSSSDIQTSVSTSEETSTGVLTIKFSEVINEYSKVVLFASNGERIVMYTLTFEEAKIVVGPSNFINISSKGGETNLSFMTNLGYDIVIPKEDDWVSYTRTKTLSEHSMTINVTPNDSFDDRETTIRIIGKEAAVVAEIIVHQAGKDAILLNNNTQIVYQYGGRITIPIQASKPISISILDGAEWLTMIETKGLQDYCQSLEISPNNEMFSRTAELLFSTGDISESLYVKQFGTSSTTLVVEHQNNYVDNITINDLEGLAAVDWGDGLLEEFSEKPVHTYQTSEKHKVTITMTHFSNLAISSLRGINSFDFSAL